eukprot:3818278-Rhodomonas_salina.2
MRASRSPASSLSPATEFASWREEGGDQSISRQQTLETRGNGVRWHRDGTRKRGQECGRSA